MLNQNFKHKISNQFFASTVVLEKSFNVQPIESWTFSQSLSLQSTSVCRVTKQFQPLLLSGHSSPALIYSFSSFRVRKQRKEKENLKTIKKYNSHKLHPHGNLWVLHLFLLLFLLVAAAAEFLFFYIRVLSSGIKLNKSNTKNPISHT